MAGKRVKGQEADGTLTVRTYSVMCVGVLLAAARGWKGAEALSGTPGGVRLRLPAENAAGWVRTGRDGD